MSCAACGHEFEPAPERGFCGHCGERVSTEPHGPDCGCDECADAMADYVLAGIDD